MASRHTQHRVKYNQMILYKTSQSCGGQVVNHQQPSTCSVYRTKHLIITGLLSLGSSPGKGDLLALNDIIHYNEVSSLS